MAGGMGGAAAGLSPIDMQQLQALLAGPPPGAAPGGGAPPLDPSMLGAPPAGAPPLDPAMLPPVAGMPPMGGAPAPIPGMPSTDPAMLEQLFHADQMALAQAQQAAVQSAMDQAAAVMGGAPMQPMPGDMAGAFGGPDMGSLESQSLNPGGDTAANLMGGGAGY